VRLLCVFVVLWLLCVETHGDVLHVPLYPMSRHSAPLYTDTDDIDMDIDMELFGDGPEDQLTPEEMDQRMQVWCTCMCECVCMCVCVCGQYE
jgi:hypothetical protein